MSNTKPVRVAVVGAGYLGRFHAQKYAQLPDAELVAVVDTNAERGRAVADECGCEAVTAVDPVLDRIDAASVVVPTSGHHDVSLPLLAAGKHLLLEKPIAPTLAEADAIVAAAEAAGVVLQVGHLERFNPAIRELVGRVDRPLFIEAHRLSGFSGRATDVDIVVDLMIHDIDILLALVDDHVTGVQAVGAPVITGRVDIANARLEFDSGCCANLTASRVSTQDMRKFRVFQAGGFMSADCAKQANQIVMRGPDDAIIPEMIEHERADNLLTEIAAFLAAVRGEQEPEVKGDAGREALRVALAVTADIERRLQMLDGA
jgi:predicted dehydrogenase